MPSPDDRRVIRLNDVPYRLATGEGGNPLFQWSREMAAPDEMQPVRFHVPFGAFGIGSTTAALDSQFDYGFGIDTESWDQLAPGLLMSSAGLSLTAPITKLVAAAASGLATETVSAPTGASSGSPAWSNPTNITATDGNRASASLNDGQTSGTLIADTFGASLSEAPLGIAVAVQARYSGGSGGTAPTLSVQILDETGTAVGTAKQASIPSTEGYITFGGETDLWGVSGLSAADVNDADFGVAITATAPVSGGSSLLAIGTTAGTTASIAGSGTDWSSPANAATINSVAAFASSIPVNSTTDILRLTNFGISIPASATILGLRVNVRAKASSPGAGRGILSAQLVKAGAAAGTAKNLGVMSGGYTSHEGGSSGDLWGTTWTQAQVTASTFGIQFTVENDPLSSLTTDTLTASIDGVEIFVTYSPAAGSAWTVDVNHVTMTFSTRQATGKFLYAAHGNTLTKLNFSTENGLPEVSVEAAKDFTHGATTSTPPISDVIVLKDGRASTPAVLVGFDDQAQIQQITAIAASGADTYGSLSANAAYAGKFAVALGENNTQALVWKSMGSDGESSGAFCRINASQIVPGAKDFTNLQVWTPRSDTETPYQVGDLATSITGMTEYQRGLIAGKPGGVYAFDQNVNAYLIYGMASFGHSDNAKNMLAWQQSLLIPTAQDLAEVPARLDAVIGISTLIANRSPIQGYPTALASYGRYLFVAYYDGVSSYILRAKRRTHEQVPHELLWYPMAQVVGTKVEAMLVEEDQQSAVWLFWGTRRSTSGLIVVGDESDYVWDLGYTVLWPETKRRYAATGEWYSSIFGSPERLMQIESLIFYGRGLSGDTYYQPSVSWDGSSFLDIFAASPAIAANGRVRKVVDTSETITGYLGQIKLELVNPVPTDRPLLLGLTEGGEGAGGVIIQGQMQADTVDRFEATIDLAANQRLTRGTRTDTTARTAMSALRALQGTVARLHYEDWYGESTTAFVYINSVHSVPSKQEGGKEGERRVVIRGRHLVGHTVSYAS